MTEPCVMLDAFASGQFGTSYRFHGLLNEVRATTPAEVIPALQQIEAAVAHGHHAAGFIAYEAAIGLNTALANKPLPGSPLLWFGIFRERTAIAYTGLPAPSPADTYTVKGWRSSLSRRDYLTALERIKEYIASGDTYQVNYTLRRHFHFSGDPAAFYQDLCRAQQAAFCADLAFDHYRILSASPELFFSLQQGILTTRPMKGTAPRGRWSAEDREFSEHLRQNTKERAENLMIVDLLRNDLGMVAETGSVRVESLFDVESLPTVHQMTSTITARLRQGVGFTDLLRALFPCGSITGAPKRRTMAIIRELERAPRGLYTGCIGFISPGPEAVFSVAIRTAVIDLATGKGTMGIGSGITWDANPIAEYAECRAKGRFAVTRHPDFQLVETFLYQYGTGYFLLERHLARLTASAAYFGFRCDMTAIRLELASAAAPLRHDHRVRLLLFRDGTPEITATTLAPTTSPTAVQLHCSLQRVDATNPFLYHKTTYRPLHSAEQARCPAGGETFFLNKKGEVTEGCITNIVAKLHGRLVTPPLACGLLPGVLREELLISGTIFESRLTVADLLRTKQLFVINSVRGWQPAAIVH